jgi:hypothetical protein
MQTRNRIIETQNDEPQIQRLAAQRALYSQAKRLRVAQFAVVLPVTIGLAVMVLLLPSLELLNIGWAVIALLVMRFYVEQREERLLDTAARIQEAFDCDVLAIERHPSHTGPEPDPEEIAEAARGHDRKEGGRERLRDWYEPPEIGTLPLHLGRIVCQRQNCRWDATQRARFAHVLFLALAIVGALSIAVPVLLDWSVRDWPLYIVAPLLPLAELTWSEIRAQRNAANRIGGIKDRLVALWFDALAGLPPDACATRSRELQDGIFTHRAGTQPVPDWFYGRLQQDISETATQGAQDMIAEALRRFPA